MPIRRATAALETKVLAAFRQACAEQALDVADRLLSILELIDREQGAGVAPGRGSRKPLDEAYRSIARMPTRAIRRH
mgnify:CR=1 FL=1